MLLRSIYRRGWRTISLLYGAILAVLVVILRLKLSDFAENTFRQPSSQTWKSSTDLEDIERAALTFHSYSRHGRPLYDYRKSYSKLGAPSNDDSQDELAKPHQGYPIQVTSSHPRLFSSPTIWRNLPLVIETDPYMQEWNKTIFKQAEYFYIQPPSSFFIDGSLYVNGLLNTAREIQLRIKHWAYAYQVSGDPKWVSRTWDEVLNAAGNSTNYFGDTGNNWNTRHFLDVGEFAVAFAIAYDWLYNAWSVTQREAIKWSILRLGIEKGLEAHANAQWFWSAEGNWNCVTNGGMITGALAVYHEDHTGMAARMLSLALENSRKFCMSAVSEDGTWKETPDYWYFGVQTAAQIASALLTATGYDILSINSGWKSTGMAHIYSQGPTEKFNYGDCGPRKLTASANALLFLGKYYRESRYTLFQRDQPDAADPLSLLWYQPGVSGAWFVDFPLDREFPDTETAWVSMRSSWIDPNALFVAMKAGNILGHQSHGNMDVGDFVLDALGERWAVELCHNDYLSPGYFEGEAQSSSRWRYYRCRPSGQNTLVYNQSDQIVGEVAQTAFATTGDVEQNPGCEFNRTSAVYWILDFGVINSGIPMKRGLRLIDRRKRILIQDEIRNAAAHSQWRMHTAASIHLSETRRRAYLSLNGQTLVLDILSPQRARFDTSEPLRTETGRLPLPSEGFDDPLLDITVLSIYISAGTQTVAVLFSPVWDSTFERKSETPIIPLNKWNLSSYI